MENYLFILIGLFFLAGLIFSVWGQTLSPTITFSTTFVTPQVRHVVKSMLLDPSNWQCLEALINVGEKMPLSLTIENNLISIYQSDSKKIWKYPINLDRSGNELLVSGQPFFKSGYLPVSFSFKLTIRPGQTETSIANHFQLVIKEPVFRLIFKLYYQRQTTYLINRLNQQMENKLSS